MEAESKTKPQLLDAKKVLRLSSSTGILSQTLKGFEPRKPQQIMMNHVVESYNDSGIALIEAGTGTGKSLAYLLPAILWAIEHKQRTVISTHTIALQEQLIQKDIPQIIKALNVDIKAVLAKGMSNYLCLRKFKEMAAEQLLMSPEERDEFIRIEAWSESTNEGSKTSLPMMPSTATWDRIGAENDNCTHMKCPHYQRCFFFKARNKAEEAQIIVANHHLLFADLAIRAETDNYKGQAILPAYSRIVIDEAHHIEDIATDFFGAQISKLGLLRLLGRLSSEKQERSQGRLAVLKEKLLHFFPNASNNSVSGLLLRLSIDLVGYKNEILHFANETFQLLNNFFERQFAHSVSEEELGSGETKMRLLPYHHEDPIWQNYIIPSTQRLMASLERYFSELCGLEFELQSIEHDTFQEQSKGIRLDIAALSRRLKEQAFLFEKLILSPPQRDKVRWIELSRSKNNSNVSVRDADLDISSALVNHLFNKFSTIVLCSATLTTNRQFEFIRKRLGILSELLPNRIIIESILDSPFNYAKQALLAIPTDLPMPQDIDFIQKATQQIWQAIEISRGGAFVLFTSYSMMQTCYELIAQRLKEHRYNLFKQGDAERQTLLSQYKETPRAVLFGTDSFWEGIDVAGEALRCVIIVKLPFKVPTEPIIQARTEAILERGGDPFMEYTLPAAIVKFKQGFGRLIRHAKDRGCIVCLDTRLITKRYGKQFIDSLPECQQSFTPADQVASQMRDFYRFKPRDL